MLIVYMDNWIVLITMYFLHKENALSALPVDSFLLITRWAHACVHVRVYYVILQDNDVFCMVNRRIGS